MGQLLLFFLHNVSIFFSYVGGIPATYHFSLFLIDKYILAIQQIITHKEHLRYSFLNLLNFLRTLCTMIITTESGQDSLRVVFTEQLLVKVIIFRCFDVSSVQPTQIFQVQAKISAVRLVFPDSLSVCYDYVNVVFVHKNVCPSLLKFFFFLS